MSKETHYGTVERISQHTAVIVTDTHEDLYQCDRKLTRPSLQAGDIVRFNLDDDDEIHDIAIDYAQMNQRYAHESR